MALDRTALNIEKQLARWYNPDTRRIEADPKELSYWIAGRMDISQSPLKPFAITEENQCYVWNPIQETWERCQLKKIYEAVRRDPTV